MALPTNTARKRYKKIENLTTTPVTVENIVYSYEGTTASTIYSFRFATSLADTLIRMIVWEETTGSSGSVDAILECSTI
jgi:hypothetical protein